MNILTCAFTGHRPHGLKYRFNEEHEDCIALKLILKEQIQMLYKQYSVTRYMTGGAMGVDIWAAEIVMDMAKSYPDISLACALPYKNQTEKWTRGKSKDYIPRYKHIIDNCNDVFILQEEYTKKVYDVRNRYMVDNSAAVIAVCNYKPSGTLNTIRYAQRENVPYIAINPDDLSIKSTLNQESFTSRRITLYKEIQ